MLLLSAGAFASDYHSPRTAALGGSSHASPLLNDAILMNPSFSAFLLNRVSFSASYLLFNGPPATRPDGTTYEPKGRNYQVSLQDGRSELFQAGVAYTQREDGSMLHIGAAKSVIKRTGFGLGAKIFFDPTRHTLGSDAVFSVSAVPASDVQLALVIDNLFQSAEGLRRSMYREFILGTKFNVMGIMLLYFDPHYVPDLPLAEKYGHEAGVEFVVMRDFFFRLGTFRNTHVPWQNIRANGLGIGAGWIAPKISFDFAVSRVTDPIPTTAYVFGATLYL